MAPIQKVPSYLIFKAFKKIIHLLTTVPLNIQQKRPTDTCQILFLISRLTHKASQSEIIYVAEAAADSGSSKLYKFELDLGAQIDEFKSKSGDYSIALLLGKLIIDG